MHHTIIGIEFTPSGTAACAVGSCIDGSTAIRELKDGAASEDPASVVDEWMESSADPVLVTVNAPLGWPAALGAMLSEHRAGETPGVGAEVLFTRATDRAVSDAMRRRTLEWISGRVAAYTGLAFLDDVRSRTGKELPLAWTPSFEGAAAVEVYPAATLHGHGLPSSGHGDPGETDHRFNVAVALRDRMALPRDLGPLVANPDLLGAAVCVLAGQDFLTGRAAAPEEFELASREGWIWVREAGSTASVRR